MRKLLPYTACIIITILACSATFFVYLNNKTPDHKQKVAHVTIGLKWLNQAQFAGIYTAQDKEYYKKQGLSVEIIERDEKTESVAAQVASGKINFGIVSTSDFLKEIDQNQSVVALAALFQYSPATIVSLKNKNIYTPMDLAGKNIGVAADNPESKLFINALLNQTKTPSEKIKFTPVGFDFTKALRENTVDAVSLYRTSDLYELEKNNIEYNIILPERFGVDLYDDILITSKEFLEEHPIITKKFVGQTIAGWEYAEKNQEEAVEIILKHDNPKYHDKAKESYILKNSLPLMKPRTQVLFGEMSPGQWDYVYELFFNNHLIKSFDIFQHYTPGYFYNQKISSWK